MAFLYLQFGIVVELSGLLCWYSRTIPILPRRLARLLYHVMLPPLLVYCRQLLLGMRNLRRPLDMNDLFLRVLRLSLVKV